jgi:aryl-alcohol dehydrogenase-like predicted oxidoreductase
MTDANYDKLQALETWAQRAEHTLTELAHAWLLAQPQSARSSPARRNSLTRRE